MPKIPVFSIRAIPFQISDWASMSERFACGCSEADMRFALSALWLAVKIALVVFLMNGGSMFIYQNF